jgi:hypothetical protein
LTIANASADVASNAESPSAAAMVCTAVPVLTPSDVAIPARRPPLRLRATTIAWFGPGARISATTASV